MIMVVYSLASLQVFLCECVFSDGPIGQSKSIEDETLPLTHPPSLAGFV